MEELIVDNFSEIEINLEIDEKDNNDRNLNELQHTCNCDNCSASCVCSHRREKISEEDKPRNKSNQNDNFEEIGF